MERAGLARGAWCLAKEGLRYIGERRDIVWASLDEIDSYRADAENPDNPPINVESQKTRERRTILKQLSSVQAKDRRIDDYPYESRQEIIDDPACDDLALVLLAGDCRRGLPRWQSLAADAERCGRIALAMESWGVVARCQIALGELVAARAAYDRSIAFAARFNRPSFALINLIAAKCDVQLALDDGWEEMPGIPNERELFKSQPSELKFAYASACASTAHCLAQQNRHGPALQLVAKVRDALLRGAPWGFTYGLTTCSAAATLWLTGSTDHLDVIESSRFSISVA
jgi:hypothetical protein